MGQSQHENTYIFHAGNRWIIDADKADQLMVDLQRCYGVAVYILGS